jgi:hypothetical protein
MLCSLIVAIRAISGEKMAIFLKPMLLPITFGTIKEVFWVKNQSF